MNSILITILAAGSVAQSVPEVYRVGDGVSAPIPLHRSQPDFTPEARRAGAQGRVALKLVVDDSGSPRDIQVERGAGFGLDEMALDVVSQWRFQPGRKEGKAVAVEARVEFDLKHMDWPRLTSRLVFAGPRPELTNGRIQGPVESGFVQVRLTVDETGQIAPGWQVLQSSSETWRRSAATTLAGWRFKPALANGQPVAVEGELLIAGSGAAAKR